MKKGSTKRLLSVLLVLAMLMAYALPAMAGAVTQVEKVEGIQSLLTKKDPVSSQDKESMYKSDDIVRVSIVLADKSTVEKGFSTKNIGENAAAMKYRAELQAKQDSLAEKISAKLGEKLDVVWNLTLAANMISANVKFGQIKAIRAISGVESVILETRYEPQEAETADKPNMGVSTGMTGASAAWKAGFTGAGSRIAIIDTGLDTSHQSFDNDAFLFALKEEADELGMSLETYMAKKGLLTADKIGNVLTKLNACQRMSGLTAEDLFLSDKLPFAFNYVDRDLDVTHLHDNGGEHGSHVAGIAAANRYIPAAGGGYLEALSAVNVAGSAPDAQVLVMKVFGKNGGAYNSDYMVAIEDAILLNCDSVNLSLGSAYAGFTEEMNAEYREIFNDLEKTETVVVISAGNNYAFGQYVHNEIWQAGYEEFLYSDDVNFHTGGSPGTYANALTVASVDNQGSVDHYFTVAGKNYLFSDSGGGDYSNAPFYTLGNAGEVTLDYVFVDAPGLATDYEGIDVNGKVVFCWRGESSFFEKGNVAAKLGAKAVIICNNADGIINLNLTGYEYTAPVISLLKADGEAIKAASTKATTGDGKEYYTGTITIPAADAITAVYQPSDYYTMSSFSSWGVPGNLTLKPEITAPGGDIYSVNGTTATTGGPDQYELMSGTSMAAPQVTGMMAVLMQYIREKDWSQKDMTDRALAQSLLMSTAKPMSGKDDAGEWIYPVLQQGAGLAHVTSAMGAASYVTVDGQSDGKVKVELGDDPEKKGIYTFSYNLNNLTGQPQTYSMDADVFTQASAENLFGDAMGRTTAPMENANVSYTVDGASVTEVTVPEYASKKVTVTIDITKDVGTLNTSFPNGFYVEAFVYANAVANGEGAETSSHSIPVLGFYGNWSDPSMFDKGTTTQPDERIPYFYDNNGVTGNAVIMNMGGEEYYFGGNPYGEDSPYVEDRNALNNLNSFLSTLNYALIRNAGAGRITITNAATGDVYYEAPVGAGDGEWTLRVAGFLDSTNANPCNQANTQQSIPMNWAGTDKEGNPLPEGTTVELKLTMAPEYYVKNGTVAWDKLGKGASLSIKFTIDNTAPTFVGDEQNGDIIKLDGEVSTLTVHDNRYIAVVGLFTAEGDPVAVVNPEQAAPDQDYTLDLGSPLADGVYLLDVADYAGNESIYRLFVNVDETDKAEDVQSVTVLPETAEVIPGGTARLSAEVLPYNLTDRTVTWSSSDETVATVDENGVVTGHKPGECTITAASNQNPEIKGTCTFTVVPAPYVLYGALQDADGMPMTFTWDMNSGEGWQKVADIEPSVGSIALASDGTYYLQDGEKNTYLLDPVTGEYAKGPALSTPFWDMTASVFDSENQPLVTGICESWLLPLQNPFNPDFSGFNFAPYFSQISGAEYFVGVATAGYYDDETYGLTEETWALDDAGVMWLIDYAPFYNNYQGHVSIYYIQTTLTELPVLAYHVYGEYAQCSMVQADDNDTLFFSYFNGETNVIYKLELVETDQGAIFAATELADAGQDVWPMMLAGAHVHAYTPAVTDPTCTEQGYTVYTCKCGDSYTADYTDPTGHSYGEWEQTKAPTCTEKGEQKRTCACGDVQTEELPALGHSYETTVVAPSCTEQGYTLHKCSACGDSYKTDYTDPTGHSYGEWEQTKAPTCTDKGERKHTCSVCGDVQTEELPALGHSYGEWEQTKAPNCTDKGEKKHTCSACGDVQTEEIPSLGGHKYVDVVTKPTSTEKGYTTHTCSECGDSYIDSYKDPVDPSNSQTGDSFSALLLALPILSAMGLGVLVISRKKWLVK